MFTELNPILKSTAITITIERVPGTDQIKLIVQPRRTSESENAALCQPLLAVGTADELDAGLAPQLMQYVGQRQQLQGNLAEAAAAMATAGAKAISSAAKATDRAKAATAPSPSQPAPAAASPPPTPAPTPTAEILAEFGSEPSID